MSVREPEDKAAKMCRVVRADNFTQKTNALDVNSICKYYPAPILEDTDISAYIDENMKLRRGGHQQPPLTWTRVRALARARCHRPPQIRQWVLNQLTTISTRNRS